MSLLKSFSLLITGFVVLIVLIVGIYLNNPFLNLTPGPTSQKIHDSRPVHNHGPVPLELFPPLTDLTPEQWKAEVAYSHGLELIQQEQFLAAIASFSTAIAANPDHAEAYQLRARVREELGDLVGAIADYSTVLQLRPYFAAVYYARSATYKNLPDLARAKADYQKAIELEAAS